MIDTPKNLIGAWMLGINQGEIETLISLYNEKAILIPTFSNKLLNSPTKVRGYFESLAGRDELSIALHENSVVIHALQNRLFSMCGIYCWRFAVEGELLSFEARFTFIADLSLPNPILHHHSSQIPRTL